MKYQLAIKTNEITDTYYNTDKIEKKVCLVKEVRMKISNIMNLVL